MIYLSNFCYIYIHIIRLRTKIVSRHKFIVIYIFWIFDFFFVKIKTITYELPINCASIIYQIILIL